MRWDKLFTFVFWVAFVLIVITCTYGVCKYDKLHPYVPPPVQVIVKTEYVELVPEDEFMSYIGIFKTTAYCPCEKCCGEYGKNRETAYGKLVVNTASGAFAYEGITVAADTNLLPYGTKIYIEGLGVRVVQDCGGSIKDDRLDIYFYEHNDALNYGVQNKRVWIINEEVNLSN